ncbi:MAG TPA: hypothetical protein VMU33_08665 [Burkholderiaceae bacterium]|nr:hypothetical protein [Burkholderiaceae bacterium]
MNQRPDDSSRALDPHRRLLDELCAETPSGAEKRRAAWSGLSEQTQMELLLLLGAGKRVIPGDLLALASTSQNGLVRYLAARAHRIIDSEDQTQRDIFARLDADRLPLVAFARHENSWTWGHGDPVAAPQQQRLAMLRGTKPPSPEQFALFVLQALGAGVPEGELLGCVIEYVRNPSAGEATELPENASGLFRSQFVAMRPLWHLLRKLPPRIARELCRALPAPGDAAEEEILEPLLQELDDRVLSNLLIRDDVKMRALRRRIVMSEQQREETLVAIAASNLELDDDEFGELLRTRIARAVWLTRSRTLAPIHLAALAAYFTAFSASQSRPALAWAVGSLKERLARMSPDARRRVRAELRLLELARQAVPWNDAPGSTDGFPAALAHLAQHVVAGDTWATYRAFAAKVPPHVATALILGEAVAPAAIAPAAQPPHAAIENVAGMPAAPSASSLAASSAVVVATAAPKEPKRRRGGRGNGGGPGPRNSDTKLRAPVVGSAAPAAPPTGDRDPAA